MSSWGNSWGNSWSTSWGGIIGETIKFVKWVYTRLKFGKDVNTKL